MLLRHGLQFIVAIVLARILSPEEFGTIALLYLFTGLASALVDGGFSVALIRDRETTQADESTVFWINVILGLVVSAALGLSAGLIASFYQSPILEVLTWVMAANVLLAALGSIHSTLLTKALNFRVQLKIGAFAAIVSGAIAIWLAWLGFGVWALAAQTLAATASTTLLLWWAHEWRPSREFSAASARRLFKFGGFLLASSILDIVYTRFYTVLIGRMFGVRELGYYGRADAIKQLPVGVLSGILSRVAFPIFAAAANDPAQLRRGVQLSVRGMMLLNLPMMIGLAAIAEPALITLLGEKWLPAAPIMQVLCLAGVFWPLHVINLNVLLAQGHSGLFFRLEVVKKCLGIALLGVGTFFGVMGIAWSTVAFGVIAFGINAHYSKKFLGYGALAQVKDFAPIAGVSAAMGILVALASSVWSPLPALESLALSVLGAGIYITLLAGFCIQAFHDAIGLYAAHSLGRKAPEVIGQ